MEERYDLLFEKNGILYFKINSRISNFDPKDYSSENADKETIEYRRKKIESSICVGYYQEENYTVINSHGNDLSMNEMLEIDRRVTAIYLIGKSLDNYFERMFHKTILPMKLN